MLQQTQVQTAIPYYRRFLKRFPSLSSLARAKREDVFRIWAGLGYYKRAENLIISARELKKRKGDRGSREDRGGFPKSYKELLNFAGFGPYTARAVSSLAFEESVGVLDGNVIRFLSRFHGLRVKWWKAERRAKLQALSDRWVKGQKSSLMNQALMELGALICKKSSPLCLICPVSKDCRARKQGLIKSLPLQRAKSLVEFWHWRVELFQKNSRWAFVKNKTLPFLRGKFVFPGEIYREASRGVVQGFSSVHKAPSLFHFEHSITKYRIFVKVQKVNKTPSFDVKWLSEREVRAQNPSSLIKKVFEFSRALKQ